MAQIIPEFLPDSATQGERRVFAALQSLPADVVVYYEPVIRRRHPDFVVIAPSIGVIVIEVKGIRLKSISHADSYRIDYMQSGNLQQQAHPSRQAREYMNRLMDACAHHPEARQLRRNNYFAFAFGHLAIMTQIRREELDASPWAGVFPRDATLCADEFDASAAEPEAILKVLRAAIYPEIPITPLSPELVSTVRSVISPTSRVETASLFSSDPSRAAPLAVMDVQQERVARQLGSGHRILYGVPGSGKTIVLIAAAKLLADAGMHVLMLCYNHALRDYLAKALAPHASVSVLTFGVWATSQGAPAASDHDAFGAGLLAKLESGGGDAGRYDAVLIDEGQDFSPSWFQCSLLALKEPADGTLIIAYDVSQNLYRAKLPTWSKVGVKAKGRTRKFSCNYRNTREIVAAAWSFGLPEAAGDEDRPQAVALRPSNCARSGPMPSMIQCANLDAQISRCVGIVSDFLRTTPTAEPRDIMVLCKRKTLSERIGAAFEAIKLPVSVSTIHGARGLQAKAVILVGAEELHGEEERALMYVALTRPTDWLWVLWSHDTPMVKELIRNLEGVD